MVAQALVCARDDILTDGLALGAEALKDLGAGFAGLDVGDLPGEVEGVLDAGV